jgi:hypothetical protein
MISSQSGQIKKILRYYNPKQEIIFLIYHPKYKEEAEVLF